MNCPICESDHRYTGFVYLWTNAKNGKWYLGSHYGCTRDGYIGSGVVFKRALKVHGIDAFTREVLFYSWGTRRELLEVEETFLIALDARGDSRSYNTKNKGLGQDPEVTRAIFLGKAKPRDQVERQRKALLASGAVRGERNARAQPVVCLSTGLTYPYARAAAKATGGHEVGISESCTKGSAHREQYWMFVDEWEKLGRPMVHPRKDTIHEESWKVVCLSDGTIFASASEAARAFNVKPASINLALEATEKSSAGHHWQRYSEWIASGKKLKPLTLYNRSAGKIVDSKTGVIYESATECGKAVGLSDVAIMRQAKGQTKQRRFFFTHEWESTNGAPATRKNSRDIKRVARPDTGETFQSISAAAASIGGTAGGLSLALQQGRDYRGVKFTYEVI